MRVGRVPTRPGGRADELGNASDEDGEARFPGMARTAPTNTDQARALVDFDSGSAGRNSVLVADTRADDTYNRSIARAFSKAVSPDSKVREFRSESPTEDGDVANQFGGMVDSICYSEAKEIHFAGRPAHLALFLKALAENPCRGMHRKVITASGASTVQLSLDKEDLKLLRSHKDQLTLEYSAVGHPDAWNPDNLPDGPARSFSTSTGPASPTTPGSLTRQIRTYAEAHRTELGGPISWNDSRAMTAFDSVWLAANGLAQAARGAEGGVPALGAVADHWERVFAGDGVPAMTGWLCLDNDGNPHDKAVSVVTLDPTDGDVRLVGVAWPQGRPQRDCDVPERK